jgi:phosphatidylglycerol---prolipoprotein diacylglyceryl transferase
VHPVLLHFGSFIIPSYGAVGALGVLLGLFLAQRTARIAGVNPALVWNLCVVALFSALIAQRLLLVVLNWGEIRNHPQWMLALSFIHHPLLSSAGIVVGVVVAAVYARRRKLNLRTTADALAAPIALGLAVEQVATLLVGSGYGTEAAVPWAVIYTDPLAARWSGTPLGIALHPVQAYAAVAFLTLAVLLLVWLPARKGQGDVAGAFLMGSGVAIFVTEFWRDPLGRGEFFSGAIDGPQLASVFLVVLGALVMMERKGRKLEAAHA